MTTLDITTVADGTHRVLTSAPHARTKGCRVGALVGVIALTLPACASNSEGAPPATDAQTAPSPILFESDRHAYALELPGEWEIAESAGTWRSLAQFTPPGEVPGEDLASTPGGSGWLVANSMAIPERMNSTDWMARLDRRVKSAFGQDCALSTGADVLAGEPSTIGSSDCDGTTVVGRSLTHAGRGYYFTIGYPTGDSDTEATLDRIVASIRFADQ
jgi:hypothetical protein